MANRSIDARRFTDLPTIQRNQMVTDKLAGGDYEGAHEIAGVGLRDTRQPNPSVSWNPMGGGGVVADAAGVRPFDFAALTARAAAEAKAAQTKKDQELAASKAK